MLKKRLLALCMVIVAFLPTISLSAIDGELDVLASHSILADVVRQVADGHAHVISIVSAGSDAHAFIPTPGDLTKIAEADLVFINGAGFEENLLEAVESAGEMVNIVNASACIEIRPFGAGMHDEDDHALDEDDVHADDGDEGDDHADDGDNDDDLADDHDQDDDHGDELDSSIDCDEHDEEFAEMVGEEEGDHAHFATLGRAQDIDCAAGHRRARAVDHSHESGACDPHVWMDPHNVIYWVLLVRDTLSVLDHDNAESYAANANAYALELVALESDFILPVLEALPEDKRLLVTSHESLGYLATTFGFEIATTVIPGMATMVEPSARDVAALIDRVRAEGVPAIFNDSYAPENIMHTIAAETGTALVSLYSDSLSGGDGPAPTYLDYMRYNVSTIVDALTGET